MTRYSGRAKRILFAVGIGLVLAALAWLTVVPLRAPWGAFRSLAMVLVWLAFYRVLRHRVAGKVPEDLRIARLAPDLALGALTGAGLFILVVLALAAVARVTLSGPHPVAPVLPVAAQMLAGAVFEEVISRGMILRAIEVRRGSAQALAFSSLLFGALHFANAGFSPMAALGVVAAGVLLGAAYIASRSLWLPIGVHAAWNFTQGGIFGFAVSGEDRVASILKAHVEGPDLLTGGAFGPEASLPAVVVVGLAALGMIRVGVRRGQFRARQER